MLTIWLFTNVTLPIVSQSEARSCKAEDTDRDYLGELSPAPHSISTNREENLLLSSHNFLTTPCWHPATSTSRLSLPTPFLQCDQRSAKEFFEENRLIAATLKPATQTKYAIALDNFIASTVANEATNLSLDQRLSIYTQERYIANARPGQRQEMSNLICMVTLMYPCVKPDLGIARRRISG